MKTARNFPEKRKWDGFFDIKFVSMPTIYQSNRKII